MKHSMNLPEFILAALLVLSVCLLLIACAFHQFCKGINESEEAKTWNAIRSDDDTNPGSGGGDPADAWKKG